MCIRDRIRAKLTFPASGTAEAIPGVIALRIDDDAGARVDDGIRQVVVVFNGTCLLYTSRCV